jgi:hypothetical protein
MPHARESPSEALAPNAVGQREVAAIDGRANAVAGERDHASDRAEQFD